MNKAERETLMRVAMNHAKRGRATATQRIVKASRRRPASKPRVLSRNKPPLFADAWTAAMREYSGVPGVYELVCVQTGDRYVGASINVGKRLCQHYAALRGTSRHTDTSPEMCALAQAFGVHSIEPQNIEVVENRKSLLRAERARVEQYGIVNLMNRKMPSVDPSWT